MALHAEDSLDWLLADSRYGPARLSRTMYSLVTTSRRENRSGAELRTIGSVVKRSRGIVVIGCVIGIGAVVPTHPGFAAPPVQAQSVAAASTLAVITTIGVGSNPIGVAVDQGDDTVYVTNFNSFNVSVINGRLGVRTDDTITVGEQSLWCGGGSGG